MKLKPLYAYLPPETHEFVDQVKSLTGINKSDLVYLSLTFMQRFSPDEIKDLSLQLMMFGPEALKKTELVND